MANASVGFPLEEQLKAHAENREEVDHIEPYLDWTLEEYQNLFKLINNGILVNHKKSGKFQFKIYADDDEFKRVHGHSRYRFPNDICIDCGCNLEEHEVALCPDCVYLREKRELMKRSMLKKKAEQTEDEDDKTTKRLDLLKSWNSTNTHSVKTGFVTH